MHTTPLAHPACVQKCIGFQPVAAWQCRHLTALLCANSSVQFDEYAGVLCTRLQRLELRSCPLPDGTFPVALCSLGQLTSLHLIRCRLSRLPPAFSNLR